MMASWTALSRRITKGELLQGDADLMAYGYDGALERARPDAVLLAASTQEVRAAVEWCRDNKVPFTARGAGTNLSGGCVPLRGGVIISLAKLDRISEIDTLRRVAVVEPGVVNLKLQRALEPLGLFYAPDPASYRVCTIGGNIAENAGGPRCLKYGVTSNHVLAVEAVLPDGSLERFSIEDDGPELAGLLVGAEGTLGIVTKAWLKLTPAPEKIITILASFPSIEASMECVTEIISRGILPRVLEAMDRETVESIESYKPAGYPKAEAVLLIESDGTEVRTKAEAEAIQKICRAHGCQFYREEHDAAKREGLWEGRRGAYAAVARIAPNVLVEDGVVPRGQLPAAYRRIREIADRHRVRVAMLLHAGDGNLHPNIAFDERDAEETQRVKAAGFEILQACVALGGSISGEHGIGSDKRAAMSWLFTPATLDLMRSVKKALDPQGLANPEKMIPAPGGAGSRADRPLSAAAREVVKKIRGTGPFVACGRGTKVPQAWLGKAKRLELQELTGVLDFDRANLTLNVEAGIGVKELRALLKKEGFYAALPDAPGTLGGLIATKSWTGIRDQIIGARAVLADGTVIDLGGKVVKNVAGYDLAKLLLGSWGGLAVILDVTIRLFAAEIPVPPFSSGAPSKPGARLQAIKQAFDPDNKLSPDFFGETC